jgi:hypothetical protein
MRGSLRPLIMKLKREEIIEIDPLTRPSLLRGIQEGVEDDVEVRPIRPRMPRRRMPTHEEEQEGPVRERMPRRRMPTQEEEQEAMMMEQMAINDMQMQMQMENEEEFLTQGKRGSGRHTPSGGMPFSCVFGWFVDPSGLVSSRLSSLCSVAVDGVATVSVSSSRPLDGAATASAMAVGATRLDWDGADGGQTTRNSREMLVVDHAADASCRLLSVVPCC